MADRRLLLVGGSGYFGARLAEALKAGWDVDVTVRTHTPPRGVWMRDRDLAAVPFDSAKDKALPVEGDYHAVINLAMPGARFAGEYPAAAMEQAHNTAQACLDLLAGGRAERLIHFSTFHVYGGDVAARYTEDMPTTPGHPYGQTHLAVENWMLGTNLTDRIAILRPTNMIGTPAHESLGEQAALIFLDLCRQVATTGTMTLRNDGRSYRDILPFDDAIAAVDLLLRAETGWANLFNLGAGQAITMQALAETIAAAAPQPVPITYGDGTDAFRGPFTVDVSRLGALGWVPSASIADEARRTIAAFA